VNSYQPLGLQENPVFYILGENICNMTKGVTTEMRIYIVQVFLIYLPAMHFFPKLNSFSPCSIVQYVSGRDATVFRRYVDELSERLPCIPAHYCMCYNRLVTDSFK
jgi:hypothetical protein